MNLTRRQFLASIIPVGYSLPHFALQQQLYTYGAWLLPVGSDPLESFPDCLEFTLQTGTHQQMEAFFAGQQGYTGRGYYGFLRQGELSGEEVAELKGLFEACDTRFPIIQKAGD